MTAPRTNPPQRVAVVGSGVAGLTAAWIASIRSAVAVTQGIPRARQLP